MVEILQNYLRANKSILFVRIFILVLLFVSSGYSRSSASDKVTICVEDNYWLETKKIQHYDTLNNLVSSNSFQWNGVRYIQNSPGSEYVYDTHGNLINSEDGYYGYHYTYDLLNNLIEEIRYQITSTGHTNIERTLNSYDIQLRTEKIKQTWVNNNWLDNSRTEYYYYQTNQLDSCELSFNWNGLSWMEAGKELFFYHPNNKQNFDSLFSYDYVDSMLVPSGFDTITYDSNWNVLENLSYNINGSTMSAYTRTVYTYDTNGYQSSYSQEDWDGFQWTPIFWGDYINNSNGMITYSYNSCYGCGFSSTYYTYDSRGRVTRTSSYSESHGGLENSSECNVYYQAVSGPDIVCENGSIVLSADSGYAAYSWSNGAHSRSISISSPGNYSVSVLDSNGNWDRSAPHRVSLAYGAVAPHSNDSTLILCRNQGVQLKVTTNPLYTYQWIFNNDSMINSSTYTNSSYTSLYLGISAASGCYRIVVTSGCDVDTSDKTCVQFVPDSVASITVNGGVYDSYNRLYLCQGDSLFLTALGGSNFNWQPTADTTRTITITKAGTYKVEVYDSAGCVSTASIIVYQSALFTRPVIVPGDSSITSNFNPPDYSITWLLNGDTILGFNDKTLLYPATGYYQTIVTYPTTCPATEYSNILYYNPDSLTISGGRKYDVCYGNNNTYWIGNNTQIFHGTPPYSYQWSPTTGLSNPNNFYTNVYVDSLQPGQVHFYVLTISDSSGKTARDSTFFNIIEQPPVPIATLASQNLICQNQQSVQVNLQPNPASVGNTYNVVRLVDGCNANYVSGVPFLHCAGTYAFRYSLNGCFSPYSDSLELNAYPTSPSPGVNIMGDTTICLGDSLLASTSLSNAISYKWWNKDPKAISNSDSSSIYIKDGGYWWLEVSDTNGCTSKSPIFRVTIDTTFHLQINYRVPSVICEGDSVKLWFYQSSYPNHRVDWRINGVSIENAGDSVYYAKATGNYSLRIYPPGSVCAGVSQEILVQVRPRPSIQIVQNNNELEAITQTWNYQWYEDENILLDDTNRFVTINNNGFYKVVVTDYHGCSASDKFLVNCGATLIADGISCHGECDGSIVASPAGIPPFSFNWSTGDTIDQIQNLCQGIYTVIISDSVGCSDTLSRTIIEPSLINTLFQIDTAACFGDCAIVYGMVNGGTPPYFYQWCNGATTSSISACTDLQCQFAVIDINGCIDSSVVFNITIPDSLQVNALTTGTTCIGCNNGYVIVQSNGGVPPYIISWTPNLGILSTDTIKNLPSGNYNIVITDNKQCEYSLTVFVEEDPLSVEQKYLSKEVEVYPNPVHQNLFFNCKTSNRMTLINPLGQIVYQKDLMKGQSEINMSNFAAGVYMLQLQSESTIVTKKLLIQ